MIGLMGFEMFNVMFTVIFLIIVVTAVVFLVRSLLQWNKNNHSPRLTVEATVVTKRQHVSRHHRGGEVHHTHTSTSYYVTFQVESGDRMELAVTGEEYGLLAEGDEGSLSFQGTRYKGFARRY